MGAATLNPSQRGEWWEQWFGPRLFLILLALVIAAGYPDVLLGRNTFVARDFAYFGYPLAYYHRLNFWQGEIPLWNPLNNFGLPFLAQWNTMVLYPGSLFYLLFPLSWSLGIFCLLHLMLGGLGMYFLALNWTRHRLGACVAGMAFAMNGLMLNSLMWPNNIAAFAWMPWVVLLVEQGLQLGGRKLGFAVVVGALQMLTGAPEVILLTWLFVLSLAIQHFATHRPTRRLTLIRFAGVVVLVAGLAAAQLLPFTELLQHSQRDEKYYSSVWPMPGTGWANLLVPLFRCYQNPQGFFFQFDQYWTTSYYVGVITLALAFVAGIKLRTGKVLLLVLVTLLGLVLALGNYGYLYPWVRSVFPGLGFIRFPIKFVIWVVLAIPLLAAFGIAWILRVHDPRARSCPRALITVVVVLLAVMATLIEFSRRFPGFQERWEVTAVSGLSRAGLLIVGVGLLVVLRRADSLRKALLVAAGFTLLCGIDPMTYANQKTPTAPRSAYEPNMLKLDPRPAPGASRAVTTFQAHQQFNRVWNANPLNDFLVKRSGLFANCNLLEGIPKADGFYSIYLLDSDAVGALLYRRNDNRWIQKAFTSSNQVHYGGLLNFVGAAFVSDPEAFYEWKPRTNAMPLVSAGAIPVFANEVQTLQGLVKPDFDPWKHVYLPLESQLAFTDAQAATIDLKVDFQSQRIGIQFTNDVPVALVLSQSFYSPWRAYENGNELKLWKANFGFQGIPVSPGRHSIQLLYRDSAFRLGAVVAMLATIVTSRLFLRPPRSDSKA